MGFKEDLINSNYSGNDYNCLEEDNIILNYKLNKYTYLEKDNMLEPLRFDLCRYTNKEIFKLFKSGITNILDYNYLLNKFGFNQIHLPEANIFGVLANQIFYSPPVYYIVYIIIINFFTYNRSSV